jgi:hypothetical protein
MRKLVLVASTVALLVLAAPVHATPPQATSITAEMFAEPENGFDGTFTATGPICSSGTVTQLDRLFVGYESGREAQILVRHLFTCADGSGSFVLQLNVRLSFETFTTEFNWSVLSGTGTYEKLHGTGSGYDVLTDTGLRDFYTGATHID